MAEQKAKLALVSRSENELNKVKEEIGPNAEYFVCDISNSKAVEKTIVEIHQKLGKIDILINNAGIWFEGLAEKHPPEKVKEYTEKGMIPLFLRKLDFAKVR